jgi:hypothetical protein
LLVDAATEIDHARKLQRSAEKLQAPQLNGIEVIEVDDNTIVESFNYSLSTSQQLSGRHIDFVLDYLNESNLSEVELVSGLKIQYFLRHRMRIQDYGQKLIFFVNANSCHWYILTNIDNSEQVNRSHSLSRSNWFIFDSCNDISKSNLSASAPILKMLTNDDSIIINCVEVFKQTDSISCGLYAMGYAIALIERKEPSFLLFDAEQLRKAYNMMLERLLVHDCRVRKPYFEPELISNKAKVIKKVRILLA